MELKELEKRLTYNFASRLNKPLVSKFSSTLVALFKSIPKNQNHLISIHLKFNFLQELCLLHLPFHCSKLCMTLLVKLKNPPIRGDINQVTRFFSLFQPNFKNGWDAYGNVRPGSLNLHEVR